MWGINYVVVVVVLVLVFFSEIKTQHIFFPINKTNFIFKNIIGIKIKINNSSI